jgi:uracil-DNA glycosylase
MDDPAARFLDLFQRAHADHPACLRDPWLMEPCRLANGEPADRPLVWSKRNGPWTAHDLLFVGAAPGNAGGMGSGDMGAHGTRIPFGGDIAGANLDVLLSGIGLDRDHTFIVAALNQLPRAGGGEPRVAELREPVGTVPSSLHLLRDTLLAVMPRLVVALGNIALRSTVAAARLEAKARLTLPGLKRLEAAGLQRGVAVPWPADFSPDQDVLDACQRRGRQGPPHLLWLLHPSAQNMSPHAGTDTVFHTRMRDTLAALKDTVSEVLGIPIPVERPRPPEDGIYGLPEWRSAIGPRHAELDALWREKGV